MTKVTCLRCQDTYVVPRVPMNTPMACPDCITAGRIGGVQPPAAKPAVEFAAMQVLDSMVVVGAPESISVPPETNKASGFVMVGPGHVPGIGGVLRIVVVDPTGRPVAVTLAAGGLAKLSAMINQAARRLQNGEFDLPPQGVTKQ